MSFWQNRPLLNGLVGTVFEKYWRAKKLAWEKVLALRIGRDSGF
jgi:hypothetical protein